MTNDLENKLIVTDPDFENIKTNLKNFLRSQDTFSDYDFEGSGLSNLIDLLAYNTHYMAFYANMIANESFLDTASIRDSVVSHAKMLGYTPHSVTSAIAKINISFTDTSSATILTLPRFTKFSSEPLDGVNYIFSNLEEVTVLKTGNTFEFTGINITEGNPVNFVYQYNMQTNPQAEFEIPDAGVDVSTIEVIVQSSSTNTTQTKYVLSTDPTLVDSTSLVFFIDETRNGKYKIYFGNGILGNALSDGNLVVISYLVSSGVAANKATNFTLLDSIDGSVQGTVTTTQAAAGGAYIESIDNIKFAAPKSYISNNRAVTKNDYIVLLQKKYPSLQAVNVWGGEENVPPVYGKVYISAKPALGYEITTTEKQYILDNIVSPLSIVTVTPEFVDPDYTYMNLDIKVTYNPTSTSLTAGQIESLVRSVVYSYSAANLNTFNSYFKLSRLMRAIDNIESSIESNQIDVLMEKKLSPVLGKSRNYVIDFHTEIKRSTGKIKINSSPGYSQKDGSGTVRQFYFEEVPLSFTGISSVNIIYGGSGFDYTPTIRVIGDGVGAEVEALVTNGKVTSVSVVKSGTGYTTVELIAYDLEGNALSNVILSANIENTIGNLRTYYYDDNKIKKIYSNDAGVINYTTGKITLNSFTPLDIGNDTKVISFFAEPQNVLFNSKKNSIITIDTENLASVKITPIPIK